MQHRSHREKVWADPLRLRQIVRNLLTNASSYGGDEIWIVVAYRIDKVVIAVIDNGDGVPSALASRIFQTTVDSGGVVRAMAPVGMLAGHDLFGWLDALEGPKALTELPPIPNASLRSDEIMAAPLTTDTGCIGAMVVTEPLSEVGGFEPSDVKLLGEDAGKISVSLQNGRLAESLQEQTRINDSLEEQVRS